MYPVFQRHAWTCVLSLVVLAVGANAQGMGMGTGTGVVVNYSEPGLKTAPLRGTVGTANDGNLIYGPMEAGFTSDQITRILSSQGTCANATYGAPGGLDTMIAEEAIEFACGFNVSLLNDCGGHANPFHYHERLTCLWNGSDPSGHSSKAGDMLDGHGLYGYYESNNSGPILDACGGHFGFTPDSPTIRVYHYHITLSAPFTVGCFGPKIVNNTEQIVTLADCRAAYAECDGQDLITVGTVHGNISYDPDCPCYDATGSTVTNHPLAIECLSGTTCPPTAAPPPMTTPSPTVFASTAPPPADTAAPIGTPRPPTPPAPPTAPQPPPPGAASRPSILLFMPDDMPFLWPEQPADPSTGQVDTWDTALVPNMNRVRSEGVTFTSASAVSPKCAPARFNLLTGRYCSQSIYARSVTRTGTRTNVEVPTCKLDGTDTTATVQNTLRELAGYQSIFSGKYHLLPGDRTVDWFANYTAATIGVNQSGFTVDAGTYATNMDATLNFTHNMEWMTSLTRDAMAAAVAANTSFFAYFAPTMPHGPNALRALRDGDPLQTPNGTLSVAPANAGMPGRQAILNAAPPGADQAVWAGTMTTDESLGSLMHEMDRLNVLNSSIVIVLMDHGMMGKDTLYEGGARIAMMARYPGVFPAGSVVSRPVTNLDMAPTLFELVGVSAPFAMDGESWLRDATGGAASSQRRFVFGEMDTDRSVMHLHSRVKLISHQGDAWNDLYPASNDTLQLYDLNNDPTEQVNLINATTYRNLLATLTSMLACHESRTQLVSPMPALQCDTAAPTPVTMTTTLAPTTSDTTPVVSAEASTTTPAASVTTTTGSAGSGGNTETSDAASVNDFSTSSASTIALMAVVIVVLLAAVVAVTMRARRRSRATSSSPVVNTGGRTPSPMLNPVFDRTTLDDDAQMHA